MLLKPVASKRGLVGATAGSSIAQRVSPKPTAFELRSKDATEAVEACGRRSTPVFGFG